MSAGTFTLRADIGLALHVPLQLMQSPEQAVDLTGYSFVAGIRPAAGEEPLLPLAVTIVDAPAGHILITCPAEQIRTLTGKSHAWDLVMTDSAGTESVVLAGPVKLNGVIAIP